MQARLKLRDAKVDWRRVEDEVILLDGASSNYLAVNPSGSDLWDRLAAGTSHEELVAVLVERYGIERERASQDVQRFVEDLRSHGLLEAG